MTSGANQKATITAAVAEAASIASGVPPELRDIAFKEVFRALVAGSNRSISAQETSDVNVSRPQGEPAESAGFDLGVIADRGQVKHRALIAAYELQRRGEAATQTAMVKFIEDELAVPSGGGSFRQVLKDLTPRQLLRTKQGRQFLYRPTRAGIQELEDLVAREVSSE